ncbi:MAG: CRISPR-associated ring nuclease [Pseudomonadota bacterium]|nr:CRISPR-associated ring nuclease [Pseudomonadota bacterium]
MKNILVCTLGASWAVIPEVLAFVDPDFLPLYAKHPEREHLLALVCEQGLRAPDELWVVTTEGEKTVKSLKSLAEWWALLGDVRPLRVWQAAGTNELAGEDECSRIRELTLRVVLKAQELAGNSGQVLLSLAGGRKTMSADLQWAGTVFGCDALLHVVDNGDLPPQLRYAEAKFMIGVLPVEILAPAEPARNLPERIMPCVSVVMPLFVGRGYRSDLLDVDWQGRGPVTGERFPLPLASEINGGESGQEFISCRWQAGAGVASLASEINDREKEGQQLLGNYLAAVSQDERHENWRSLYRLAPRIIEHLRKTPLTEEYRDWFARLPKAELHCHLGGILDVAAQKRVGATVWQALSDEQKRAAMIRVGGLLREDKWAWEWPEQLRSGDRSANCAALLVSLDEQVLEEHLFAATRPRFALLTNPHGFAAYERPGELSGSAILGQVAAIAQYAGEIYDFVKKERLLYCELRGSPLKYLDGDGLRFLRLFYRALTALIKEDSESKWQPVFGFVIISDRRDLEREGAKARLEEAAKLAVAAGDDPELRDFVVGMDLAGNEKSGDLRAIAGYLEPVFACCLPVTIHAGEGTPADKIWQAAYHLNADRIGHGLTLVEAPDLAARFRNRNICLELCPSSNLEVVGFHDPASGSLAGAGDKHYPLKQLWEMGLPLTICTDNPGISKTTLTNEYLTASRLVGGLTLWDALAMIKQAFSHSFLPAETRESLMKRADKIIFKLVAEDFA